MIRGNRRERGTGLLAAVVVVVLGVTLSPFAAQSADASTNRLAGADRYATSATVSAQYAPGVPVAYVASGANYPDALSAAPAAARQGGPLLLTAPARVPASIVAELQRLKPQRIVVVGGTGAVSDRVFRTLAGLAPSIRRDAGRDRYETSRIVIDRAFGSGTTTRAYVATGRDFPDALSAAAAAGAAGAPVLLVDGRGAGIDGATRNLLSRLGVSHVAIAGGTGVVNSSVASGVKATPGVSSVTRLGGVDRFATAAAINRDAFPTASRAFVAVGTGFADALSGAALAGLRSAPLHLAPANCVPAAALQHLSTAGVGTVTLLGGTGVLSSAVQRLTPCSGPVASLESLSSTAPLTGALYVDPTSVAAREAARLQNAGRTADAALLREISQQPQAVWINGNETGAALRASLATHRDLAAATNQRLVVVTYAIPFRDCGSYSSGGLSAAQYAGWNATIADTLRGSGTIVIVEPDALAGVTVPACASIASSRPALLKNAVETLAAAGLHVYIDAGHSNWVPAATMASLLRQAGIASARGFASNVSNFRTTASEEAWASEVSTLLGGARYVIDVSRNGNGPNADWCNPLGRALGQNPALATGSGALDGLLWVKRPGESDGTCNGGPGAGQWWEEYALDLVRRR